MPHPFPASLRGLRTACCFAILVSSALAQSTSTPPADSTLNESPVELSAFVVTTNHDRGYMATNAVSGSMTNEALKDIPASLTVINAELIRDLGAQNIQEILRYATGVHTLNPRDDTLLVRGFGVAVPLEDGFRESPYSPSEQVHVERVEILRGPAGLLYGNTFDVGGIINRITKQPDFKHPVASMQFQVRDHDWYQVSFDYGQPLAPNFAFRIVTNNITSKDYVDFMSLDRVFVRPNFTLKIGEKTAITVNLEYITQRTHNGADFDYWNSGTNSIIVMPRKFNAGEDFIQSDNDKYAFSSIITHIFNSVWQTRIGVYTDAYREVRNEISAWEPVRAGSNYRLPDGTTTPVPAGQIWLNRTPQHVDRTVIHGFFQGDLFGRFTTGPMKHKLLLGAAYAYDEDGQLRRAERLASINITDLSYNALAAQYGAKPTNIIFGAQGNTITRTRSFYAADVISFFRDQLSLVGGVRYDEFTQDTWNIPTDFAGGRGVKTSSPFHGTPNYTPRAAVVYKPFTNLSVYASYSENYVPATTTNPDGSRFKPVTGEQLELGVKATVFDGRLNLLAAAYDLLRDGVREADPTRPGYQVQLGEQLSRGAEVSFVAVPVDNFQILGSYAYVKTEEHNSVNPLTRGLPINNRPKQRASVWAKYKFTNGALKNFGLGLGIQWVDDSRVIVRSGPILRPYPGYTLFEASASYNIGKWWVNFNVPNLFDEDYYARVDAFQFMRGGHRKFILSCGRSF